MDTIEANKVVASVLVAGIAFFMTGLVGDLLVHTSPLKEPAIKIDVAPQAAPGSGPAQEEALPPIAPLLAKADPAAGEALTKKLCVSCHTFDKGGKAGVGPNLYNVVGDPHGHMEGFNYSAALKGKQGPWDYAELNEWLHKPSSYAPGTRMAFAGISNPQQRADVIDYLHTLSANPKPLPAPDAPVQPASQGGQQGAPQKGTGPGADAAKAPAGNPAAQAEGAAQTQTPTEQRANSTTPPAPQGASVGAGSPTPAAKSP
jgi:cytochrome c